jgi:LacI family transcriptional regulator
MYCRGAHAPRNDGAIDCRECLQSIARSQQASLSSRPCLAGFIAALRAHGLSSENACVAAIAYTREAGQAAADELLARFDVSAIAAANDLLALGAYRACAARGLRVPQDVSIVGHNDMPLVDMVQPPLTTIRISHVAMGEEAARLLVREIETPGLSPERIVTAPELVVRGSTAGR